MAHRSIRPVYIPTSDGTSNLSSLGIDIVSLPENVDTPMPTWKLVFVVLPDLVELERTVIAEWLLGGPKNARAKGKRLAKPQSDVETPEILRMRAAAASGRAIARNLGVSATTAFYAARKAV